MVSRFMLNLQATYQTNAHASLNESHIDSLIFQRVVGSIGAIIDPSEILDGHDRDAETIVGSTPHTCVLAEDRQTGEMLPYTLESEAGGSDSIGALPNKNTATEMCIVSTSAAGENEGVPA